MNESDKPSFLFSSAFRREGGICVEILALPSSKRVQGMISLGCDALPTWTTIPNTRVGGLYAHNHIDFQASLRAASIAHRR